MIPQELQSPAYQHGPNPNQFGHHLQRGVVCLSLKSGPVSPLTEFLIRQRLKSSRQNSVRRYFTLRFQSIGDRPAEMAGLRRVSFVPLPGTMERVVMRFARTVFLTLSLVLAASPVQAGYTYGFVGLSKNDAQNTATGESQLQLDVRSLSGGRVEFKFRNIGTTASSITNVYFDGSDDLFQYTSSVSGSRGVRFQSDATPQSLPSGSNLLSPFETDDSFSAKSGRISNGVNPGELLNVQMKLKSGYRLWNVVSAINSLTLRVGLNVQGFSNGGTESFINPTPGGNPPPMVPEPTGLALAGIAAGCFFLKRRRGQS